MSKWSDNFERQHKTLGDLRKKTIAYKNLVFCKLKKKIKEETDLRDFY